MRTLETARNVINSEEIEAWLRQRFADRYPTLVMWIGSVVRKWAVKKAPTKKANVTDGAGLPDWLRTAMQKGDVPEEVVLDDALEQKIQPVLDYMADLLHEKPDTNIAAIGFEVAEQRSIKWHERLARQTAPIEHVEEDGANIIKTYPDGYTWRTVVGKDAMIREGDRMGHCVGRFNYHAMVLRAKAEIVSLRDQQNDPHVTIEIGQGGTTIHQIKGRANQAVVPKYLPYVEDFLKSRNWQYINFDGAESLRQPVVTFQVFQSKPWFEHNGLRAGLVPNGRETSQTYVLATTQAAVQIGKFTVQTFDGSNRVWVLSDIDVLDRAGKADFFRALCVAKNLRISSTGLVAELLIENTTWTRNEGWSTATNDAGKQYAAALVGVADAKICWSERLPAAWYDPATNRLYMLGNTDKPTRQALAIQLGIAAECWVANDFTNTSRNCAQDINMTSWLEKQLAGRSVRTDTDESLLNSLLAALKQPNCAEIKAAYLRVKSKDRLTDSDFKALGFATGGRAINAIGTVLLCSLPIKNTAPFRSYVFHKPNTMNCWMEILAQPDHLLASLETYGLSKSTIKQIVDVLRNEFLRLVPTAAEIKELDLDSGVEVRLRQALGYAKSHRQNPARSKELWAKL